MKHLPFVRAPGLLAWAEKKVLFMQSHERWALPFPQAGGHPSHALLNYRRRASRCQEELAPLSREELAPSLGSLSDAESPCSDFATTSARTLGGTMAGCPQDAGSCPCSETGVSPFTGWSSRLHRKQIVSFPRGAASPLSNGKALCKEDSVTRGWHDGRAGRVAGNRLWERAAC